MGLLNYLIYSQDAENSVKEKIGLGIPMSFRRAGFVLSARSALISRGKGFASKYISSLADRSGIKNAGETQGTTHIAAGIRNDPAGIKMAREITLKQAAKSTAETHGLTTFHRSGKTRLARRLKIGTRE